MRKAPDMRPAPVPSRAGRRPSPLRADGALRAIAAVMTGVDPDAADIAVLAGTRVDAETLHLGAAVALQQMLQTAPITPEDVTVPAPATRSVPRDAYYLALALAEAPVTVPGRAPRAGLDGVAFLEAAALVGAMQARFLAAACSQVTLTAFTPELLVSRNLTLGGVLKSGGALAAGIGLVADHSKPGRREQNLPAWVFATTQITVAGLPGAAVVDAGPETLPAELGARMAAPVAVEAAPGIWPTQVVMDCLRMCAPAVRRWVAALPRHLDAPLHDELIVTPTLDLAPFLISPATAALTGAVPEPATIPLSAGPGQSPAARRDDGVGAALRRGGELESDRRLEDAVRIPAPHRDAVAVLAAAPAADLSREVEVTVNLPLPGWVDVAEVVRTIRERRSLVLAEAVLGWTHREVVVGRTHRISVRARVRSGVACRTRDGETAVLLPAGTTFDVVDLDGTEAGGHITVYAVQAAPVPGPPSQASASTASATAVA